MSVKPRMTLVEFQDRCRQLYGANVIFTRNASSDSKNIRLFAHEVGRDVARSKEMLANFVMSDMSDEIGEAEFLKGPKRVAMEFGETPTKLSAVSAVGAVVPDMGLVIATLDRIAKAVESIAECVSKKSWVEDQNRANLRMETHDPF